MSEKRKICLNKPPVPVRPKNLVVFNSKHLPKPPETFSSESVTNFIRDLNLDIKEEESEALSEREKQHDQSKYDNTDNSDGEEDMYGYLEPVALPADANVNKKGVSTNFSQKKSVQNDPFKLSEIFQKIMRNTSGESVEIEGPKPTVTQKQWQRPLPLPPVDNKKEIICKPWYKNVDRKKGEEILKNGIDGYFLVRPSSNTDVYLTLTLWYCNRVYNIPIRKRKDGKFALGTPKSNEQCFDTVECMIKNYQSEKLVLFSNGVQSGKTLLTAFPP